MRRYESYECPKCKAKIVFVVKPGDSKLVTHCPLADCQHVEEKGLKLLASSDRFEDLNF